LDGFLFIFMLGGQGMRTIVEWLKGMEIEARDLYLGASRVYVEDVPFAKILDALGQDEALHVRYMEKADQVLRENPGKVECALSVDEETKEKIEGPFRDLRTQLPVGKLSKEEMLRYILVTECSEWNDIFLYVVQTLTPLNRELQLAASQIDAHRHRLESMAAGLPDGAGLLEKLSSVPDVWTRKLLVVDANPAVAGLVGALFRGQAHVSGATDGKEALQKIAEEYYDVIVTDLDLPGMTGMQFFKKATEDDVALRRRFLFLSGFLTRDQKLFLHQHELPHLQKPGGISTFREAVARLIEENTPR